MKTQNIIIIYVIMYFLVLLPLALYLSNIQYNYDLSKCNNLNSSISSYDFNQKVEMNAQYNEKCYFLNYHPFAYPSYLLSGACVSLSICLVIIFPVEIINYIRSD